MEIIESRKTLSQMHGNDRIAKFEYTPYLRESNGETQYRAYRHKRNDGSLVTAYVEDNIVRSLDIERLPMWGSPENPETLMTESGILVVTEKGK